nr:copia protein [Tanacetum cinerariifolium]
MPLWNDGSLFDSSLKDSDGDNKYNDGPSTKSEIDNQESPNTEISTKDINTFGPSINTASSNINTASPTVNTVRLSDDFFGADNDMRSLYGVKLDISNISTTYPVPTTPNTRINKDHSLDNGYTQEEGIDYDEVFAPIERIKAIRLFLAYASYMGFLIYQMDVKSAFLYGRIEEEVYVCQPLGFEDPNYPDKVYKELCTEFEELMHHKFQMSSMEELTFFLGLEVKQKSNGIFISQDKYVDEILRKFKYEVVKSSSTPMDKQKALFKDSDGDDEQIDIMAMQKQTVVVTSTTEAEYVVAVSCYGQILWIQNQWLDYRRLISWQCKKQTIVATSTTEAEYVAVAVAHCVNTPRCDEDSLELKELMVFFVPLCVEKDGVEVNAVSSLVLKPPPGMNLAALWHQQSSVLPQTKSLTSQVDHQLGDMSHHQDIHDNPSLTKKVFANMKRVGTSFFRVITPLFKNMLVPAAEEVGQAQDNNMLVPAAEEVGQAQDNVSIPTEPSTSKPYKKHKLSNKVLDLESEVIDIKYTFTDKIQKLKDRVDLLEEENRALVTDIIKGTKSMQNRTKPSTKQKAWKSQKSTKFNKKSNPTKSKPQIQNVKKNKS